MKIGFTGTREGVTEQQIQALKNIIKELEITEFHHGDCVGADETSHNIIKELKPETHIVIHPPTCKDFRAYCKGNIEIKPKPYLDRNKDIVNDSEFLIAMPNGREKLHSGTWSTVRYARRLGREIRVIYPNGTVVKENSRED